MRLLDLYSKDQEGEKNEQLNFPSVVKDQLLDQKLTETDPMSNFYFYLAGKKKKRSL